jgi:hypothetical protein
MIKHGTITREDLDLFVIIDSVDDTFEYMINNMQK